MKRSYYVALYRHRKGYERTAIIWQDSAQKAKRRAKWVNGSDWHLASMYRSKVPVRSNYNSAGRESLNASKDSR